MAKIEGSIYCKKCGSEIKWCYLIPQHISETRFLQAEIVPEDTILLNSNPVKNKVKLRCRNCDCLNVIDKMSGRGEHYDIDSMS